MKLVGTILVPKKGFSFCPYLTSHSETCTCGILPCVLTGYQRFRSSGTVSIVSLIRCISNQNGITGISEQERRWESVRTRTQTSIASRSRSTATD